MIMKSVCDRGTRKWMLYDDMWMKNWEQNDYRGDMNINVLRLITYQFHINVTEPIPNFKWGKISGWLKWEYSFKI